MHRLILKKERVCLTPARAMLLAVLYDLVRNGEFVSEFASEKVCYFFAEIRGKRYFSNWISSPIFTDHTQAR
ncbi:MAG: hypothetical protein HC887_04150 [Desulfobacteraceae bacterium]|nr:hypothetical protein [Desulfobacteraceae bacterium]